jgi:T5SS/PEP-CTERM-associated repeat protein
VDTVFGQNAGLVLDADQVTLNLVADYTLTTDVNNLSSLQVGKSPAQTGSLTLAGNGSAVFRTQGVDIGLIGGGEGVITAKNLNWIATGLLDVGAIGSGTLNLRNAATVSAGAVDIGRADGEGLVSVSGAGCALTATEVAVGASGTGTLSVTAGGAVNSTTGTVNGESFTSAAIISGNGSAWNTSSLFIGGNASRSGGNGLVTVTAGGALTVTSTLRIYPQGILQLKGGTLTTAGFSDSGGQFAWSDGTLRLTGASGLEVGVTPFFTSSVALGPAQNLQVDKVLKIDAGKSLFAQGGLSAGSVTVAAGGQLFTGAPAPGFGTGLTNAGDLVFTAPATVASPVTNSAGGRITTLADVTFSGPVQGAGNFYGAGRVTFAGGFNPAASAPAAVTFEGPVSLVSSDNLRIELAGAAPGQYDSLHIAGDLALDGTLDVALLNAFQPQRGQQFLIADVDGALTGRFTGLTQGARVGTFGGADLFISYTAGDGNDVALATAPVPEPTALATFVGGAGLLLAARRRRTARGRPVGRAPRTAAS